MEFTIGFALMAVSLVLMALFAAGRLPARINEAMKSDALSGVIITSLTLLITAAIYMIGAGTDRIFRSAGMDTIAVTVALLAMFPAYGLIAKLLRRKACPMWGRATSHASARSRTTSCLAW